jgi:serine/threonine protein kinase
MESWVDPSAEAVEGPLLEALLSKNLTHPNIVQTYDYAVQLLEPDSASNSTSSIGDDWDDTLQPADRGSKRQQQVWLIQQYCNHGTLGDAVDRGWLLNRRDRASGPNMLAVLHTAMEIAAAMQYLHQNNVLHGDLTCGNVLLVGVRHDSPHDKRSFSAKIGDFGLSRVAASEQVKTATCGTLSYMPPELVQDQLLTKAADAYSFGVLCWEMVSAQRAWAGRSSVQIMYARSQGERLDAPQACPSPGFKALIGRCLQDDHSQRPSFDVICEVLGGLLDEEIAAASQTTTSS